MFKSLTFLLTFLFPFLVVSQTPWAPISEASILRVGERRIIPERYLVYRLNTGAMEQLLGGAPERFTAAEVGNTSVVEIPLPDGTMSRFLVAESPVMAPDLQGRYVETRCYTGKGLDDPSALLKCDLTPWGFHAMVLRGSGSPVFIDPYQMGDRNSYVVYYKSDYLPKKEDTRFSCETVDDGMQPIKNLETAELQGDCRLRRYRLALACTGEYAAFHGGTKPLVLAALNTSMNRVNGVYEKDFAVTMQLVAKNDTLIFLTPSTDPYTNGNGGTMLGQNVTTCNARIGASNYDIGHVFSTGGGGIAGLGVVCSSSKAQGVTGGGAPVGDPFDIDYVAHEMGHQFGADHTQNNNCNRVVVASMEPGSASTIMGYAGICNPNVQSNSDDYFHAISLQQVGAFTLGSGNTCAVKINTGNTSPVVSAGLDYTIPKSTYFVLSATGSDLENDAMTYCWEQMDPEFATMPPVSTNASGPLFRSFKGTASPLRYFPRLTDILTNANPTWEKLPSVARQMKFRVTVRDNSSLGGCTEEDDMVVTVASNSGPFVVTEPNTSVTWFVGDTRSIKWSVAGTTQAPVSCTQVRITLSLDGGFTYPVVLANSVPNTGTAMITVPNQLSTTCRVRVQGANNVFFDVSDQNFIIQQPPSPTFLLTASPEAVPICVGAGDAVFEVSLAAIAGFNTPVTISVTGAPLGAVVTVTPNQVLPNGSATVVVSGLTGDMAGTYALSIQGSGGSVTQQVPVELVVRPGPPIVSPLVVAPIDSAVGVSPIITLQWVADPIAASYEVELASNPNFGFGSILGTYISTSNSLSVNLNPATVYYWRIRGINTCGMGTFRGYSAFQTADLACNQEFVSTDVPKVIDPNTVNTATTTLGVSSNRVIADVNVKVVANHSYVGDLVGTLVTPVGQNIVLFDRPGVPADQYGCANDNLNLEFDDEAMQSAAQLEVACLSTGTALLGAYQPVQSLSALEGQLAAGTWSLKLEDTYADDGGAITSWSIDFCFTSSNNAGLVLQNLPLVVGSGTSSGITSANLEVQASGSSGLVRYVITRLPAHGSLVLAGVPLVVGSTFTQEQLGLNLLGYTNSGDGSLTDSFGFDVEDLSNKSWIHNQTFLIEVVQNNLQVIVDVIQPVPCYNGIGGTLQAVATGLDGNYEFSLNGGTFQSDGLFTNLSPGTYVVVVRGQFGFSSVSLPVVLANPNPVTVNAILDFNTVTAMASGGTAPYTYSLGGNFAADSVFVAVPNGVYQLIVQDANGCTAVREIIVAVNTMIVSLQVNSAVLCNGGADGEILVNVGGGTAPFLFSLNGGPFVGSGLFSGLSAGTYVVVVRDSAGFESTTNPVLVVEPSELSVAVVSDLNTVTAVASGGTVGYSYSLGGVDFQTTGYFDGLMSGIYMVVAVDGNGCRDTVSVEVVVPPLVLSLVSSGQVSCAGGQDGSLQVAATGGVPGYLYSIDGGVYQMSGTFIGLSSGVYTVRVQDAQGMITALDLLVSEPDSLGVEAIVTDNQVMLVFTGGVAPYTYVVNGIAGGPLTGLDLGSYTVVATDSNGCNALTFFEIRGNTLEVSVELAFPVLCHGGTDAVVLVCIDGGYPPYSYTLSPGGVLGYGLGICGLNLEISGLGAGAYTFSVTDTFGYVKSFDFVVPEVPELGLQAVGSADGVLATASGGTPPYLYSIDGINYQSSGLFAGLMPGVYQVIVQDANGCLAVVDGIVVFTGVEDYTLEWGLRVFPNPGSGWLNLEVLGVLGSLRVSAFDVAGRRVYERRFDGTGDRQLLELDLQGLPAGAYWLELTDGLRWSGVRFSLVR